MKGFPIARQATPRVRTSVSCTQEFPIARQASPFRRWLAAALLVACGLCLITPAHAASRPAVAFAHLLPPPDGDRQPGLADWVRSHDRARDMLESRRIPTVVSGVPAENPLELGNLAALRPELLITTSPRLYEAAQSLSRQYPDTVFFACTDEAVDGNISGYQARTYEAHYLAGLLAGTLSEGVVGYLGNAPCQREATRHRNANAFTLGAQAARPGIRVLFAAGGDVRREVQAMLAAGADIINMERARPSLLRLMREHAVRYIGFTEQTDDPLFLAAPEWNWGKAFGDLLAQVRFGIWRPRNVSYGIREGVVSLSPLGPSVPAEVRARLQKAEEALRAGASPFRGPVFDDSGRLRIPEGKTPDEATLRSMNWNVRGLETLPSGL